MNNRDKDIIEKRKSGWTLDKIGIFYGITRERVRQITRAIVVKAKNGARLRTVAESQLYDKNMTNDEVFEVLGKTVSWKGKRHKVKTSGNIYKGFKIEEYVSNILNEKGINHTLTNSRKHDIILGNGKTIEVRSRHKVHPCQSENFYYFPLVEKQKDPADIFVLVIVNNNEKHCFIIPNDGKITGIGFTYPRSEKSYSKWSDYENRWDLLL